MLAKQFGIYVKYGFTQMNIKFGNEVKKDWEWVRERVRGGKREKEGEWETGRD